MNIMYLLDWFKHYKYWMHTVFWCQCDRITSVKSDDKRLVKLTLKFKLKTLWQKSTTVIRIFSLLKVKIA